MKNPTAESPLPISASAPCKDKRTLVLFLFGALILVGKVLVVPLSKEPPAVCYGVQQLETGQEKFQVIRFSGDSEQNGPGVFPLQPMQQIAREIPARYALYLHQPLPINRADRSSLELLPGVGPHLAQAIVASVQQQGPISDSVDLQRITGIGPKTAKRLAPMIRFQ
jgi:competence protein ComEA